MEGEMRGNVDSPTVPANQFTQAIFGSFARFRGVGKTVVSVIFSVLYEKTKIARKGVSLEKRRKHIHFTFRSSVKISRVFKRIPYCFPNTGNDLQCRFRKQWRKDESRIQGTRGNGIGNPSGKCVRMGIGRHITILERRILGRDQRHGKQN